MKKSEDFTRWVAISYGFGQKYKKRRARALAPQGVLQSLSKCQQSKVDKISDRYGMSKKILKSIKKIFFGLEKKFPEIFEKSQNFK